MSEVYDAEQEIHDTIAATTDRLLNRWVLVVEWIDPETGEHFLDRMYEARMEGWEVRGLFAQGADEKFWADEEID